MINFLSTDELVSKVEQRRESDFFLDSWHSDPDSEGLLRDLFHSQISTTWPAMPIRGSTS